MKAWTLLSIAILFEVMGTSLLKHSDGFARWHWGMLSIACYSMSFWFLAPVLKLIPVGVAYAIWAGAGITLITLVGFFVFGQKLSLLQIIMIMFIVVGAVGLNLTTDIEMVKSV